MMAAVPPPLTCTAAPKSMEGVTTAEEEGLLRGVYAMGFAHGSDNNDDALRNALLARCRPFAARMHMSVALHVHEGTVEALYVPWSAPSLPRHDRMEEGRWAAELEEVMHVQALEPLLDTQQGITCVDRFIQKRAEHIRGALPCWDSPPMSEAEEDRHVLRILQEDEGLLDLYRIVSGGRIHYWDTRAWRMPATALHRLYLEEQCLSGELLDRIAERHRLVPSILQTRLTVDSLRSWLPDDDDDAEEEDADGLTATRRCTLEHHELELRTLEDQEIDLIHQTELLRDQIRRARRVLSSQSDLAAAAMARRQRRLDAMSGGEDRKRRRVMATPDSDGP